MLTQLLRRVWPCDGGQGRGEGRRLARQDPAMDVLAKCRRQKGHEGRAAVVIVADRQLRAGTAKCRPMRPGPCHEAAGGFSAVVWRGVEDRVVLLQSLDEPIGRIVIVPSALGAAILDFVVSDRD